MAMTLKSLATPLVLVAFIILILQVVAEQPISEAKGESAILQESIIKEVNENPKAGWKAAFNPRFSNFTVSQLKRLLGVKPPREGDLEGIPVLTHPKFKELPKEFDARKAWPQCRTIGRILGQSGDGSCLLTNLSLFLRPLKNNARCPFQNISLSVNDVLACCGFLCGEGCNGGYPISAWQYFVRKGVVTEKCDPYFDNIGCSHPGCEPIYPTPQCSRKCVEENLLWSESKHFGVNAYIISSDPYSIMTEVYKNGPVEVTFYVYEDFSHYKSGVYKHVTGKYIGGHAAKLIGWGTSEEGEDYWLVVNSWNTDWGDDGYFKIRRGTNECEIESIVAAGLPSARNLNVELDDDASLSASI
ncbi:cytochrome b6-f complex iron-sulfur subunit, chloroplastic [Capsicum annuum]|uniref:Peptidase C1A papain C-terminal domain-containing protein n=1 Tax=Capsicum annuum TaxID=4072 RepID=A0A2G2XYS6_CAPAN|nr:cytochrome b6-f complex iron-sulfur subunit, chloroplastic [Capsicum annuum]PHT62656.1 hypothetical protein T459_33494 [Capsicum annuum]